MLSIVLPAARRAAPGEEQSCWGDLRVALASVAAYAPGVDVVVGWNGAGEPRGLPDNPSMRLLRQAPGIATGGGVCPAGAFAEGMCRVARWRF